ncbi:MAG: hypothetical protein K5745_03660 [Saccharofermentans sp.]|nr:hypothetical protein [Saccharofermentans sp.]
MIRKLNKKPDSKRGAILVMVVFILAMAIIFISACMMLTQATRQRAYVEATSSQARLTCTSTAEAFYQALMTQEFTDNSLETLAKANSTLTVLISGTKMPGLTADTTNCTTLHLYNPSGLSDSYIYADFKTTIGTSVEGCRIVFKHKVDPPKSDIFSNQIDIAGDMDSYFDIASGAGAPAGVDDNNVVIRGDYKTNTTGNINSYSNFIFTGDSDGSVIKFERTENYYGDVVFLKDAKFDYSSTQGSFHGNVFFIGDSGESAFANVASTTRSYAASTSNWVFVNRSINVSGDSTIAGCVSSMLDGGNNVLVLNGSLSWSDNYNSDIKNLGGSSAAYTGWYSAYTATPSSLTSAISSSASKYAAADYTTTENQYPKTTDAFADLGIATSHTAVTCTNTTLSGFVNTYNYATYNNVAPEGTYYFASSGNAAGYSTDGTPLVVILDGNKDYTFYFAANTDFSMNRVIFATVNPNSNHRQMFILESGANLSTPNTSNLSSTLYRTGFVSTYRAGCASPETLYNQITTGSIATDSATVYDSTHKPSIFIFGAGDNTIHVQRGGILEAYIGLFDDDYSTTTSKIEFTNDKEWYVYGRWEVPEVSNSTSQPINLRYCPNPNSSTPEPYVAAVSDYSVIDFIYGQF